MAYSNNFKSIHDTPFWLPANQLKAGTSNLASFAATNGAVERYIYYMLAGFFYRYDTKADSHIRLQTPLQAPSVKAALQYDKTLGTYGNCLAATTNTITVPPLGGDILVGYEIKIINGTGKGQSRTITNCSPVDVYDSGVFSGASASTVTDNTKRWKINELVGMQLRIVNGVGVSQHKKILYNSETVITIQDVALNKIEVWNNSSFNLSSPYAIPAAGSQYFIEKATLTVDTNWTIIPDSSSSYVIKGGGIFMFSSFTNAPFSTFQYYDVLADAWTTKNALGGINTASLTNDFDLAYANAKTYLSGTATSGSTRTLVDSSKSMIIDRFVNFEIAITGGTGMGQTQRIVANTATSFEVARPWIVSPDATSTYTIGGNSNSVWLAGNTASSLFRYAIDEDQWYTGQRIDYGVVRTMSCQFPGEEAFAISSGTRNAAVITSLSATPTAGGTGYVVGDVFNITTGGTGGKGRVTAISSGGIVTAVELYSLGINYTTGSGKVTSTFNGVGSGLTVNILSIGVGTKVLTVHAHNLGVGDVVTFSGCTEALYNTSYTIAAVDTTISFEFITTATANMAAATTLSTTVLVDSTKNWVVNEHVGKLVKMETILASPVVQFRRIISNTATSITFATATVPVTGTYAYSIMQPEAYGRDVIYKQEGKKSTGRASGGSTTTLIDSTKAWIPNQWASYRIRIMAGAGVGNEFAITSNDATTLTYSAQTFTPDSSTVFQIMETYGTVTSGSITTITDTSKNWPVNFFSGKRVIITSGTGQRTEALINTNTSNTLTLTTSITAPDTTSTYTILAIAPRTINTGLFHIHTMGITAQDGNYLYSPRGNTFNTFDLYDIPKDMWITTTFNSPQSDVLTSFSCFEYDGVNSIYFTNAVASDFIQIHKINLKTKIVESVSQTPFPESVSGGHAGQLISLVSSPDGGLFMFLALHNSRLLYKTLLK